MVGEREIHVRKAVAEQESENALLQKIWVTLKNLNVLREKFILSIILGEEFDEINGDGC